MRQADGQGLVSTIFIIMGGGHDRQDKRTKERLAERRLQTRVFLNLGRISRLLERRIAELFVAQGLDDVTPQQANVLMVLFEARSPMTARALASEMAVSEQTMGRFLRSLEEAGWVTRTPDPADRRAILVRLTPKAYRTLPNFLAVSNAMLDQAFAGFGSEAVQRIADEGLRITANLERDREDDDADA